MLGRLALVRARRRVTGIRLYACARRPAAEMGAPASG
jgi:hypothetical protein